MPLPLIPLFGALLRSAGTAAASLGARAGAGAMLKSVGTRGAVRFGVSSLLHRARAQQESERQGGFGGLFRRREEAGSPASPSAFPASMHRGFRQPPPPQPAPLGALKKVSVVGVGALKVAASFGVASKAVGTFADLLNNRATEGLRVFNTQIAAFAARKEVFQIRQNIKRGREVAGSTTKLGDAIMQTQEMKRPYSSAKENTQNWFAEKNELGKQMFLAVLEEIGLREAVKNYNAKFNDVKQDQLDLVDWLLKAKDGAFVDGNEMLNRRPDEHQGSRF